MNETVLVIEDDEAIIRLFEIALKTNGYKTLVSESGLTGISLFLSNKPDIVLLDLGLPDIDGNEVLSQIRKISSTPVIVVSARGHEKEKVEALDGGADDYVTKPFNVGELMARIRVALRKQNKFTENDIFSYKDLTINFDKYEVTLGNNNIHLTPIEFKILKLLVENQGKVLTHKYIQESIWGYENDDDNQSLRVYMAGLRRKIETDTSSPQYIITEMGIGYRFSN